MPNMQVVIGFYENYLFLIVICGAENYQLSHKEPNSLCLAHIVLFQ